MQTGGKNESYSLCDRSYSNFYACTKYQTDTYQLTRFQLVIKKIIVRSQDRAKTEFKTQNSTMKFLAATINSFYLFCTLPRGLLSYTSEVSGIVEKNYIKIIIFYTLKWKQTTIGNFFIDNCFVDSYIDREQKKIIRTIHYLI